MARQKKSRKVGKIGISKENTVKPVKTPKTKKPTKGKKSGSRQNTDSLDSHSAKGARPVDAKLGSKVKINLSKYKQPTANSSPVALEPIDELNAIESDTKLDALISAAEERELTSSEQRYIDTKLKRHKVLCELLGITEDDEEEQQGTDPFSDLDAISKRDFED